MVLILVHMYKYFFVFCVDYDDDVHHFSVISDSLGEAIDALYDEYPVTSVFDWYKEEVNDD